MNLYEHAEDFKQAISSICSRDIANIKMFQSDSLIVFWPSKYNFHCRTNSEKVNDQIFQ